MKPTDNNEGSFRQWAFGAHEKHEPNKRTPDVLVVQKFFNTNNPVTRSVLLDIITYRLRGF